MNIITAIRAIFQAKTVVGELKPIPKTGFVSSEFWGVIFADLLLVLGVVDHFISPTLAAAIIAGLKVAYMIVRLILKSKHIELTKIDGLDDLTETQVLDLMQAFSKAPAASVTTVTTSASEPTVVVTNTTGV